MSAEPSAARRRLPPCPFKEVVDYRTGGCSCAFSLEVCFRHGRQSPSGRQPPSTPPTGPLDEAPIGLVSNLLSFLSRAPCGLNPGTMSRERRRSTAEHHVLARDDRSPGNGRPMVNETAEMNVRSGSHHRRSRTHNELPPLDGCDHSFGLPYLRLAISMTNLYFTSLFSMRS